MERLTTEQLETLREIDDLHDQIANLRKENDFAQTQFRTLRVRCNRYERTLGMDDEREAA